VVITGEAFNMTISVVNAKTRKP